jgi:hypothetical protein
VPKKPAPFILGALAVTGTASFDRCEASNAGALPCIARVAIVRFTPNQFSIVLKQT